jgi:hypothetical protein
LHVEQIHKNSLYSFESSSDYSCCDIIITH